eukprot:3667644-Rhodomonas_salina.4
MRMFPIATCGAHERRSVPSRRGAPIRLWLALIERLVAGWSLPRLQSTRPQQSAVTTRRRSTWKATAKQHRSEPRRGRLGWTKTPRRGKSR